MSMWCNNESDHRRDARRDFERGRKNRDYYDRNTFDGCKEAYTNEYDRLQRDEERRQEERREEEEHYRRQEAAIAERRREEQQAEYYERERQYQEQCEREMLAEDMDT